MGEIMSGYRSPLRDLARAVTLAASQHKAYGQVITLFQHVDEYLNMRAYVEEIHHRQMAEIQARVKKETSDDIFHS